MQNIYMSIPFLILGTLIFLSSIFLSKNIGVLNLRTSSLGVIWIGYFLSPILALFDGKYSSWMLNENYISEVILYALICMLSICIGWRLYGKNNIYLANENKISLIDLRIFIQFYYCHY